MEVQTQTTPTPQAPVKISKLEFFIIIGIIAVILVCYYAFVTLKQAERSQELITSFSLHLERDEYKEAYDTLVLLNEQGLGSHLEEARLSMDQLLAFKIEDVTLKILNEKEQDFSTYTQAKGLEFFRNVPGAQKALELEISKTVDKYLAQKVEYTEITYLFQNMHAFGFPESILAESREKVERTKESQENILKGQELFAGRDFLGALGMFTKLTDDNPESFEIAQIGIKQSLTQIYTQVEQLSRLGQYSLAQEKLQKLQALLPENSEIAQRAAAIELARQEEEKNLIPYTGKVQHIFFHPLIAYPELTFDGDLQARGFNEWFVTIPEFGKIIESLYAKGFILVNITDLYEVSEEGGQEAVKPKQLYLPKGKMPLVISIDDLNYYRYMIQNGTVHKLILDEKGKVATYSKNPKGEVIIAYDNEIVPILDSFVDAHPDFSFHGAKGVIALTGYEGILGYRTDEPDSPGFEQEKAEALKVVQALKDSGWLFASHSQGHLNVREDTYDRLLRDTQRWQKEVGSLIGPTDVYIYPFGASVQPDDPKFKALQEAGFKMFCSVGPNPYLKYSDQYILMDRRHIDGIALFKQAESVRDLFDSEDILDPVRPPL